MKEENTYFTTNVKWMVSIALFVVGVVAPFYSQRQDIALIQQSIGNINVNHEAHIQDILQEMKEMKQTTLIQQGQIIDLQKQLITIASKK